MDRNNAIRAGRLLPLALPIMLEQLLRSLMGTVNTFMVSRISDEASAAVGVANQVINVVIMASTMLAAGTAVLINQNLGAGRDRDAARITMNSLTVSAAVGAAISAVIIAFTRRFITRMGLQPALVEDAAAYLRVAGTACAFQFVSAMAAASFRCRGLTQLPVYVIGCNNVVNLLGSLLVIRGCLPVTGVRGIAAVRLMSEGLGLALILALLTRQRWGLRRQDLWRIRRTDMAKIFRIGLMTGTEGISFTICQLVTTGFIAGFPARVLSAKVYVQTVNNYTYMAGMSVGQAAQIVSGHRIGGGDTEGAYRFIRRSWLYVLGCNVAFSVLFWLCSGRIIRIFTADPEIAAIARTLFLIDIFTCMGRSLNHCFNYGLRSAGYVTLPVVFDNLSMWIVSVGLGWVLVRHTGLGIAGLWISACADEWLRGLFVTRLWMTRRWERIDLVGRDGRT